MNPPRFFQKLAGGQPQRILFYGTSLTHGAQWTTPLLARLEERFPGLVTSLNTARCGETSVWGLANFQEQVVAHRPDVLFMEFAINDATARFNISKETARGNLEAMIDLAALELPGCEIILQTMNPVIDRPEGHTSHRRDLDGYYDVWREVAQRRGLLLIDHAVAWNRLLAQDEATLRRLIPDGVHPIDEGYATLVLPEIYARLQIA